VGYVKHFSNVESIKAALDQAAALKAQQDSTTPEKEAQKAAAEVAAYTLNSIYT
jgi:hypothetical protein